ncbi:MAG: preprotein translocase subunit SecE [Clostridia bacterium]|nr:preprotein translocase subunit SecE [Clostridia bacterium]
MSETNVKKTNKIVKFFKETKAEMKKVTWPGKQQLIRNTLVILSFIIITGIVLSICDVAFTALLDVVTKTLK